MSSQPGTREVAYRLFATEFDDADFEFSESDEERAPNYVVTPTGARVNRLFLVGVLTELERVNDEMLRARVVDPTGAFVVYAGQYQPDELAFLESVEPPTFLAVTGKARTFQPEDSDRVYTSVRPESISEVDADTRDRWVVDTARRTLNRVGVFAAAIETGLKGEELRDALESEDVDHALAQGVALALDHYGTTSAYLEALRNIAIGAARVVAGKQDEVERLSIAPDEGDGDASTLADLNVDAGSLRATDTESTSMGGKSGEVSGDEPSELEEETELSTTEVKPETSEVEAAAEETEELGDFDEEFDPDEEVLNEEERHEIEEQYGTEFSTGTEVETEPGTDSESAESEPEDESIEPESAQEAKTETEADTGRESETEDVDPQDAVLEIMADLDEGDGADREVVIERAVEQFGLDADAAEEGIEDAMMSGQAYEPDEGKIKPI